MINMSLATAIHHSRHASAPPDHAGHIRQIETVHDLFAGRYEAVTTVGETFTDAVLGIGVAEGVDGEIIHVDGITWRIPANGVPERAGADLGMPFAVAAYGGTPITRDLPSGATMTEITTVVDGVLAAPATKGLDQRARGTSRKEATGTLDAAGNVVSQHAGTVTALTWWSGLTWTRSRSQLFDGERFSAYSATRRPLALCGCRRLRWRGRRR